MALFWDESKINEAVKMYKDGKSFQSITDSIGGNPETLSRIFKREGIETRRRDTIELIVKFLQDNNGKYYKLSEIGNALNIPCPNLSTALCRESSKDESRVVKINGKWGYNHGYDYSNDVKVSTNEINTFRYKEIMLEHMEFIKSVMDAKEKRIKTNLWQLHA